MAEAIYAADMSYNAHSSLVENASDANKFTSSVNNFTTGAIGKLKGEQWEAVKTKLSKYNEASAERIQVADLAYNTISALLSHLAEFISPFSEIDPSKEEETEKAIEDVKEKIADLYSDRDRLYSYSYKTTDPDTGESVWKSGVRYLTEAEKAPFNAAISTAEATLTKLELLLEKIKLLISSEWPAAEGQLAEVDAAINQFKATVDAITPSGLFNYGTNSFDTLTPEDGSTSEGDGDSSNPSTGGGTGGGTGSGTGGSGEEGSPAEGGEETTDPGTEGEGSTDTPADNGGETPAPDESGEGPAASGDTGTADAPSTDAPADNSGETPADTFDPRTDDPSFREV